MSTPWALDLGTSNTGLARWDVESERPRMVALEDICRAPADDAEADRLEAPRLIPSATEPLVEPGFWARMSARRLFVGRYAWGRLGWIGREAQARQGGEPRPTYVPTFKPWLGRDALRVLARARGRTWTARDVAFVFLRQLFAAVRASGGERIRDLVVTTPVDAYESYRAELQRAGRRLGLRRLRFVDEPVAAAIGYDLAPRSHRHVLVVDFGGGTLDLALVALTPRELQEGSCRVLAKEGRPVGGDLVDRWLLDHFCERLGFPLREDDEDEARRFWFRLMLAEARRVKEAVFFQDQVEFIPVAPEEMRRFEARLRGDAEALAISRDDVHQVLAERGLFEILDQCVEGILRQARAHGLDSSDIEDVLMVGGSTLLPQVYGAFEARFGRDRVRAWKPFEAVAYGAAAYAAGHVSQSDFIVHDYAFVTHDRRTHEAQHTVIVPRGTRAPTAPDFWKRRLVPTCSLGEPERIFKLVICEIGLDHRGGDRRFSWDADGRLHSLDGAGAEALEPGAAPAAPHLVVQLNASNPTLGRLDPPHPPGDTAPRLEIAFGVNEERWLVATVRDLQTRRQLMDSEPVVRLL